MASLKDAARYVLDDAKDAIAWIACWKTGRSWHCEALYGVECDIDYHRHDDNYWHLDDDAAAVMAGISVLDPDAILVNPFYDNLGELEDMTLATLMDGLRFQYEARPGTLMDALNEYRTLAAKAAV